MDLAIKEKNSFYKQKCSSFIYIIKSIYISPFSSRNFQAVISKYDRISSRQIQKSLRFVYIGTYA